MKLKDRPLNSRERAYLTALTGEARFKWVTAAKISGLATDDLAAEGVAKRMRRNPAIRAALDEELAEREIGRDVILSELADIAMGRTADVRTRDRIKALHLLGQAVGLFKGGNEVTVNVSPRPLEETLDLTVLTDEELEAFGKLLDKMKPPED